MVRLAAVLLRPAGVWNWRMHRRRSFLEAEGTVSRSKEGSGC
jgi:hypothetical protein